MSTSIRRLLTEGISTATEYTLLKKDGTRFIGEVNAAVIHSPDGSPMRMIAIIRDVTERKRAEDTLRESEERFSRFFRASPIGAGILRLTDSKFADVNDVLLGLFGYTREEIIGQTPLDLGIWDNPEDRAKMVEILQRQGRVKDFETRFRFKSGEIGDALFSAEVIEAAGQQYILSLIYDITERKRGEKERKKLEEQLFQAQKMESVGRLAGGVAHDFNNILGVIIGRAEMALQQDIPADKLRRNLEEILKAGLRSADLTRQLLAFARKQTAVPKILDLNGTISGMLEMLRRLIGEDIDLFWAPELDLWKVKIDPSQVDQILANLAVNSRDAISGAGAITMRTENVVIDDSIRAETPEFIPGEYVLLTVSDTGAGMSQEVREKIFEPFFTTKEVGKGTGLGLSTVYGIVKQNDGFVYAASEPGKGTTFKICLPRFEAESAQAPSEEAAGKLPTGTETILLVEDDEGILNLSRMILENLGYTVLAASAPEYAINVVEDHPEDIHLLITDVVMPGMNGRELAEQLGAIRPNLKRLYMSGYTADLIAYRGILDEGVNFIQKPFRSDELAARVRQVLDHLE
jgi:PAS domain S-box-containing protein